MPATTAADPALKSFVSTRLLMTRLSETEAEDALAFLSGPARSDALPVELAAAERPATALLNHA